MVEFAEKKAPEGLSLQAKNVAESFPGDHTIRKKRRSSSLSFVGASKNRFRDSFFFCHAMAKTAVEANPGRPAEHKVRTRKGVF